MRQGGGVPSPDPSGDLRLAVHRLRRATRSPVFRPVLHLGALCAGSVDWFLDDPPTPDVGLRAEIVAALLSRALLAHEQPMAWLTRPGVAQSHDLDIAWAPVVARVFAESGLEPGTIAVVTKAGWYEPLGDGAAHWKRLRMRKRR